MRLVEQELLYLEKAVLDIFTMALSSIIDNGIGINCLATAKYI